MRPTVADMAYNHRMTWRRPFGDIDPHARELIHQPVRRAITVFFERWIGRNGRDAQQIDQPVSGGGQVSVNARKYIVKGHGISCEKLGVAQGVPGQRILSATGAMMQCGGGFLPLKFRPLR